MKYVKVEAALSLLYSEPLLIPSPYMREDYGVIPGHGARVTVGCHLARQCPPNMP